MKKKYKLKIGRLLLVIILAGFGVSLLVIGINKNIISVNAPIVNSKKYNEIPKPKVEESKISLIAVGDALIHGAIYQNVQNIYIYNSTCLKQCIFLWPKNRLVIRRQTIHSKPHSGNSSRTPTRFRHMFWRSNRKQISFLYRTKTFFADHISRHPSLHRW